MIVLSTTEYASSLAVQSPLPLGDKMIYLVQRYLDFDAIGFDDRCQIPRFPQILSFLGLLSEFEVSVVLEQFASIFGVPLGSSISLQSLVPSYKVVVKPSIQVLEEISFEWDGVFRSHGIRVIGRPNQCLCCHTLGQLVKDCPLP